MLAATNTSLFPVLDILTGNGIEGRKEEEQMQSIGLVKINSR